MQYDLSEFSNKDVIYIGGGTEEKSFHTFLQSQVEVKSYQAVVITDKNRDSYDKQLQTINPETAIVVKGSEYPGRLLSVPYTTPTKVLFACTKQSGTKTVVVTGTKGKSTVASLIYRMLQQGGIASLTAGGDFPLFETLSQTNEHTVLVLELSSMQLAELDVSPDMAVITNLLRNNIDYHGSLENYWEAKRNAVRYMTENNTVIFSPESEIIFHWLADVPAKKLPIDLSETVDMSKSQLIGELNKHNYMMARTAAQALGVDLFSCQHILKNFKPLPHHLEKVRTVRGITFIDDAIAIDAESTTLDITACVREVAPVGCVILGGKDVPEEDFAGLVKLLYTLLIPKLILFPETAEKIKAQIPDEGYTPEIFETSDMHEAVMWAADHCPSGSVCLLSTASPSAPIWKDYKEKGELFQKSVLELPVSA
jgi:UDP-N-acetylmuramoyl-L-alanine---L-glutamate ligase